MKTTSAITAAAISLLAAHGATAADAQAPLAMRVVIQADKPGPAISPLLYGIFFEDINYAADGGLYAEMVQNRSFDYYATVGAGRDLQPLTAWSSVSQGGRKSTLRVEIDHPQDAQNPNYCQVNLTGDSGEAGLANAGFGGGLSVKSGASYDFSMYSRWLRGSAGPVTVALQSPDGSVLDKVEVPAPGKDWRKNEAVLRPNRDEPKARLVITAATTGTLGIDMVSLFPQDTFKGRKNGMRKDLAQAIADLKPGILRFPGGCLVHGHGLDNAYRWKETVGPLTERRPKWNRWGYHQTMGLGYFEYFQLCEDIGAAPLPILPAGVSCGFNRPFEAARGAQLEEMVQDAIDVVEFANGPADSKWGSVRAKMGHPAPFHLKYVGLGNEEHDTTTFREVFPQFVTALRAKHPEIKIVGTSGLGPGVPLFDLMEKTGVDISDEHYYESPEWFIRNQHRFDNAKRGATKIFVGEYASRGNRLFNALAEAVYLTGIERNSDLVVMGAYAPLLARYNFTQWQDANLIYFDNNTVVRTPNYHVQHMFSTHLGSQYLPASISANSSGADTTILAVSCTIDKANGKLFMKVVNPSSLLINAECQLQGAGDIQAQAELTLLQGPKEGVNTLSDPMAIAPVRSTIQVGSTFTLPVPPFSAQVVTLKTRAAK